MAEILSLNVREEVFPPRDPSHGTNDEMIRRTADFRIGARQSLWEQTDYGHPGRFNDWDQRQTDAALQARTPAMRSILEALSELV